MKKIYFLFLMTFIGAVCFGQATYTWNQTGTASWTTAANWTPNRTTPASDDILVFNNGAATTVTALPAETIGQLLVSGNTTVNLQAGAAVTLTVSGGAGTDLSVASGSQLNFNAINAITLTVATGATGSISGSMTFSSTASTAHRLTATDASAITFNNGSSFTAGTNFSGNAFGTTNLNSIIFASGSTYFTNAGGNPFGAGQPFSVVVFQAGSLYKHQVAGAPSFSGRTYANFEYNIASAQSSTGGNAFSCDNLTVSLGTFNCNMTGTPGHSIKGNISVAAGATLNFNPASAGTMNFNGSSAPQTISNSGTLTFAANQAIVIANTAATPSVTFNQSQTISGSMTVNAGSILATNNTLTLSGTPSINGSFQINQGGFATGGTWTYGPAGTLIFNNSSGSYGVSGTPAFWPSSGGPVNVIVQNTGGITMNIPRTVSGLFQTSAAIINSNNLTFNGICQINTGGFFNTGTSPVYGTSSLLRYNTGGTYGRGAEWSFVGAGIAGTDAGYPNDVQVSNNTTLNLPNGSNSDRACNRDLTIDAGSNLYADFGGGSVLLIVGRNFNMAGNVSLGGAIGGDLKVRGNFTRSSGIFTPNSRAVFFDGLSGDQTISGVTTFDFLVLDKAAGNLLLTSSISLNQTLTLTTGKVVLGANDLSLLNTAPSSLNAGSFTSYVVTDGTGVFRRAVGTIFSGSDYFFPVGNITNRQIATINFGGSLTANNTLAARFITGAPGNNGLPLTESGDNMDRTSVIGYWEINAGSATADPYTGSFNAVGFGDIIDFTKLHLLKRDNVASNWVLNGVHVATTGSNANAVLQRTGMSGFSQFGVGGEQSVSLPVSLLSFSGYRDGSRNQLRWITSGESNNSGFEVQRSADGVNYNAIGFVNSLAAGGNSTSQLNYEFTENNVVGSKQYYRLRQVNIDGNSKLSNIVLIKGDKPTTLTIDGLFPNPANSMVNVLIASPNRDQVTLVVTDIAGRTLLQKVVAVGTGNNTIPVDISRLINGTYLVKLICESDCETAIGKFVKQ